MTANDTTNEKREAGTKDSVLPTYICSACTQIFQRYELQNEKQYESATYIGILKVQGT